MGMIDDQTTGPWIKKNQKRENISVILKVIIISNINVKKTTFVFVLIMISFVQNIWDYSPLFHIINGIHVLQLFRVEKGVVVLL